MMILPILAALYALIASKEDCQEWVKWRSQAEGKMSAEAIISADQAAEYSCAEFASEIKQIEAEEARKSYWKKWFESNKSLYKQDVIDNVYEVFSTPVSGAKSVDTSSLDAIAEQLNQLSAYDSSSCKTITDRPNKEWPKRKIYWHRTGIGTFIDKFTRKMILGAGRVELAKGIFLDLQSTLMLIDGEFYTNKVDIKIYSESQRPIFLKKRNLIFLPDDCMPVTANYVDYDYKVFSSSSIKEITSFSLSFSEFSSLAYSKKIEFRAGDVEGKFNYKAMLLLYDFASRLSEI